MMREEEEENGMRLAMRLCVPVSATGGWCTRHDLVRCGSVSWSISARCFDGTDSWRVFGRSFRFSLAELAGHMSFLMLGLSFAFRDILWLRGLALCAGIQMMIFNRFHPYAGTLWLPLRWNAFFLATNLVHLVFLLMQRYTASNLTDEEKMLYDSFVDTSLDTVDYMKLIRSGEWQTHADGYYLTREGFYNSFVLHYLEGQRASVSERGALVRHQRRPVHRRYGDSCWAASFRRHRVVRLRRVQRTPCAL